MCRAWILELFAFGRGMSFHFGDASSLYANAPLWILYASIAVSAAAFFYIQRACKTSLLEESIPDIMAVCGFAGCALMGFGAISGEIVVLMVGLVLAGMCGGFFEVKWALYFLGMSRNAVCLNMLLAIGLSSVCGTFTNMMLAPEAFFVSSLVLLAFATAFDRVCGHKTAKAEGLSWGHAGLSLADPSDHLDNNENSMDCSRRNRMFHRIVVAVLLYTIVHMSGIALESNIMDASDNFYIRYVANFIAVGLLLLYFLVKGMLRSLTLARFVLPLTTVGFLVLLIDASLFGWLSYFILCFSNKLFEILVWILVFDFIDSFGVAAARVFGGVVAARNFGSLIGSGISFVALGFMVSDANDWTGFVSFLVMLVIVVMLWMISDKAFFDPLYQTNADQRISAAANEMHQPAPSNKGLRLLAAANQLTNRETDVFLLLARGKNRVSIADELFISQNTVHSHIVHIYQKFGVHGQQELIKLVESSYRYEDDAVASKG